MVVSVGGKLLSIIDVNKRWILNVFKEVVEMDLLEEMSKFIKKTEETTNVNNY